MIAKAKWFNRRKYTGWGLTPKSWQGVIYIIIFVLIITLIQSLPLNLEFKIILTSTSIVFVFVDLLQVMSSIKLDEREQKIEAIAERNASWTIVVSIALEIIYILTIGKELKGAQLMPLLVFPLITGVGVKGLTNFILDKRGL